jgi:lysozyme family protein
MSPSSAIDLVIRLEGGYVNDPRDPGGETKYGISKKAHPNEDIANLTVERAREIYRADYWNPTAARVYDISPRLAAVLFDSAVNQGNGAAVQMLQAVLDVEADGIIGQRTVAALQDAIDQHGEGWVIAQFQAARVRRYAGNRDWPTYGRGWMVRVFTVMASLDNAEPAIQKPSSPILAERLDQIARLVRAARAEVAG